MKILLLGAGGIGCELLKVLGSLPSLESIDLIDMDTIEVTNLHRQFLFRKEHVGQPKAIVAAMMMESLLPTLKGRIKPRVANVFALPLSLFSTVDVVLNALDNIEARSRISLMCLLTGKLLIDAGTVGIEGQTTTLCGDRKVRSIECFNCISKPSSLDMPIPVCTIRQTPTSFSHCVIWAKEILFNSLFCVENVGQGIEEKTTNQLLNDDNPSKTIKLGDGTQQSHFFQKENDTEDYLVNYAQSPTSPNDLLRRVFHADIVALALMENLWLNRTPPNPLSLELLERPQPSLPVISEYASTVPVDDLVGILYFYIEKFIPLCPVAFDKDNHDVIAFIHAAACIRAHIFGICTESRFSVRGMDLFLLLSLYMCHYCANNYIAIIGKIVPAVISTNAIVAGLVVLQLLQLEDNGLITAGDKRCSELLPTVYYAPWRREARNLFLCERVQPPNPGCEVCGVGLFLLHVGSTSSTKLADIVSIIVEQVYPEEDFTILAGFFFVF